MGSKRSLAAAAVLSVGLGGCVAVWGGSHNVTHKDDTSIVIESDPSSASAEDLRAVANDHCKLRGGEAVLQSARRSIAGIDTRRFRCDRTAAEHKEAVMLLRRAVGRFSAREWASAADLATKALAFTSLSDNQVAAAYMLRGYCQFALGRLSAAIADLDRALEKSPDLIAAIRLREALLRAGKTQQRPPRQSGPQPADEEPRPPVIQF
jgi:tetratricopeptide (TPR) repeat protein